MLFRSSGEHGIGTAKAPYIGMELDQATLATMRAIKRALDPLNIMNPGKIFPEEVPIRYGDPHNSDAHD